MASPIDWRTYQSAQTALDQQSRNFRRCSFSDFFNGIRGKRAYKGCEGSPLECGAVGVNVNDTTELQAPFGGWKLSGLGRELGPEGLMAFRETKHIKIRVRSRSAT